MQKGSERLCVRHVRMQPHHRNVWCQHHGHTGMNRSEHAMVGSLVNLPHRGGRDTSGCSPTSRLHPRYLGVGDTCLIHCRMSGQVYFYLL